MRGVGHLVHGSQIIHEEKVRLGVQRIEAAQEKVHRVRMVAADAPRQLVAGKIRHRPRGEGVTVAHAVEGVVLLNVLSEVDGVPRLATHHHAQFFVQTEQLVLVLFHDQYAPPGRVVVGQNGERVTLDSY